MSDSAASPEPPAPPAAPYRVLARKYRPQRFDDLIGQDVLVRTLSNAFATGRIAHAFLLTGIRGIGKTTTARIIARGLNCIGADGQGGPTIAPCGECANCRMILEDRHVDIIEMDAASRTGVDDIRDIIDSIQYAPSSARYKVYIIDEVHMLSKNAFNALLKTLEEPPAHVTFIFATTELRKIPITIISRCQRFDLRRIETEQLARHLHTICEREAVQADTQSLTLIAAAAEGSVRDALSLLDQAIALSADHEGTVTLDADTIRDMLGMSDKSRLMDLLEAVFAGEAKQAVTQLRHAYEQGADPQALLQDLLTLAHYLTRIRVDATLAENVTYSAEEQQRAAALAQQLSMPALTRAWQMLMKGLEEMKQAPHPLPAAEMILIRLCYAASLPPPGELVRQWQEGGGASAQAAVSPAGSAAPAPAAAAVPPQPVATRGNLALAVQQDAVAQPQTQPEAQTQAEPAARPQRFAEAVELFRRHKELVLYSHLYNDMRPVSFRPGHIEALPIGHVPADFAARVGHLLSIWCDAPWRLSFAPPDTPGEPSLREQALKEKQTRLDYAASHPYIQQAMAMFEGAEIVDVQPVESNDGKDSP